MPERSYRHVWQFHSGILAPGNSRWYIGIFYQCVLYGGCCMLLLEAVPALVAEQISRKLTIPVLGIGAGHLVDGQLVIMHDLVGFYPNFRPWFAKCYIPVVVEEYAAEMKAQPDVKKYGIETKADGLNNIVERSISKYCYEVKSKLYPSKEYIYPIKSEDLENIKTSKYWF